MLALCKDAGFAPNIVYEDSKYQTRLGLVAAGTGITFVPESLQKAGLSGISYCPLIDNTLQLQLALAWRRRHISPVMEGFLDAVEKVTTEKSHH